MKLEPVLVKLNYPILTAIALGLFIWLAMLCSKPQGYKVSEIKAMDKLVEREAYNHTGKMTKHEQQEAMLDLFNH